MAEPDAPGDAPSDPGEAFERLRAVAGLCGSCRHAVAALARRGAYLRCRRSATDPGFDRYPRLPRWTCPGFERRDEPGAETGGGA